MVVYKADVDNKRTRFVEYVGCAAAVSVRYGLREGAGAVLFKMTPLQTGLAQTIFLEYI